MRIGGVKSIWRDSQLMLMAVIVILHRVVELGGLLICDALGILILALPVPVFVKHIVAYRQGYRRAAPLTFLLY